MDHVKWHSSPAGLRSPVMVAAFTGWNDAADAASNAVKALIEGWDSQPLCTIDPEEFTDFASIRPHVRLNHSQTRDVIWPQVGVWRARTPDKDVVLVLGPEPSLRWRLFTEQIIGVAKECGVEMVLTLGALLADVAHSRPVHIIGTTSDTEMMDRYDLERSQYEGPTGIVGVLHDACSSAGLQSASFWAATPTYASNISSPKAALALIRRAGQLIGVPVPTDALVAEVDEYDAQVDALVAEDDDLPEYVERLEQMADEDGVDDVDDEDGEDDGGIDAENTEELIEELERFLREQG